MPSVDLERTSAGYAVRRVFPSLPAAMRGVDALLTVSESAFEPTPKPVIPANAPLLAALERAESDDDSLGDDRLILEPAVNTGD
jgi:hypothetical protein